MADYVPAGEAKPGRFRSAEKKELDEMLLEMDSSFSEYLLHLIDESGMTDAAEVGARMGIDNDHSVEFTNDSIGQRVNYEAMSEAISYVRACSAPLRANWKASIEKDRKSRRR